MAFKILSSEEIELLTESQQDSYKKELSAYYDRVKFVEQMEKFENTQIKPYKPNFVNISVAKKPPETNFVKPEYTCIQIKPIRKPIMEVSSVNLDKPIVAVVPQQSKITQISTEHLKKIEHQKPILPNIIKSDNPINSFKKPEYKKTNLPNVVKPYGFSKMFLEHINIESIATKNQNKPTIPQFFGINTFSLLNSTSVKLPTIQVNLPNITNYDSVQQDVPILPKVEVNKNIDISFKIENKINSLLNTTLVKLPTIQVNLPNITNCNFVQQDVPILPKLEINKNIDIPFKLENKTEAQLPKVSDISSVNISLKKINLNRVKLPIYQKSKVPIGNKINNNYEVLDIQKVTEIKVKECLYNYYKLRKSLLHTINKPLISNILHDKKFIDKTLKVDYPSINITSVKPFNNFSIKNNKLPKINSVDIPDIYSNELYKKLLSLSKEKSNREVGIS